MTNAKLGADAVTGEKVNEASSMKSRAPTRSTLAFARVDAEGTAFPASSKGIGTADVRQGPLPGIYCVNAPGFTPRGAQVTPRIHGQQHRLGLRQVRRHRSVPPPQVEVRTYNAGSPLKASFYIVLYR